jgi:ribosomal protein S18 acetylase RimI-like enzyme
MKLLHEVKGVRYELFDMHALDEMAVMVADAFARYEPMTITQNFSLEELVEFIKLRGPKAAQEELTVLARDQETGQVVGALLTDDFASAPPEGIEHLSEKLGPTWALLDALDTQYKQGKNLRVGDSLHLLMIAVTHQHTGSKVAQNLIQACLENGIRKGYKAAVTEATGVVSQHIFRKCGFVDRIEISYKTFTYHGKRVFATIKGCTGTILMDKVLV